MTDNDELGTQGLSNDNPFQSQQTIPTPSVLSAPPVAKPAEPIVAVEDEDEGPDPEMPQGEPNVALAPSQEDKALTKGLCNIGMESVMIPNKEAQLAGFYAPNASTLVAQYPQYKFIQTKGQAHGQTVNLS